jgi:hypothetical protein
MTNEENSRDVERIRIQRGQRWRSVGTMTSKETVTERSEVDDTVLVPVKTQPIMYGFAAVISTFLVPGDTWEMS